MYIDHIKVDIIEYPYSFFNIETIDGIHLASKEDICAMKMNAIVGRGSKKNFYDLHQLLKEYNLDEILELYKRKYNINNMQMIMRSLIYFEDADNEEFENNNVVSLQKETWNIIKKNIRTVYNKLLKKSTPLI